MRSHVHASSTKFIACVFKFASHKKKKKKIKTKSCFIFLLNVIHMSSRMGLTFSLNDINSYEIMQVRLDS